MFQIDDIVVLDDDGNDIQTPIKHTEIQQGIFFSNETLIIMVIYGFEKYFLQQIVRQVQNGNCSMK